MTEKAYELTPIPEFVEGIPSICGFDDQISSVTGS